MKYVWYVKKIVIMIVMTALLGSLYGTPPAQTPKTIPPAVKQGIKCAAVVACFGSLAPFMKGAWADRNWAELSKCIAFGGLISYGVCEHTQPLVQGAFFVFASTMCKKLWDKIYTQR